MLESNPLTTKVGEPTWRISMSKSRESFGSATLWSNPRGISGMRAMLAKVTPTKVTITASLTTGRRKGMFLMNLRRYGSSLS
eukprot:09691_6